MEVIRFKDAVWVIKPFEASKGGYTAVWTRTNHLGEEHTEQAVGETRERLMQEIGYITCDVQNNCW